MVHKRIPSDLPMVHKRIQGDLSMVHKRIQGDLSMVHKRIQGDLSMVHERIQSDLPMVKMMKQLVQQYPILVARLFWDHFMVGCVCLTREPAKHLHDAEVILRMAIEARRVKYNCKGNN